MEDFLEYLNTQHTIPFPDTLVIKDSEGRLTTSVCRKPTHTDQYLSYDSHHPQSVKRGAVKCLSDRSKNISTKPSNISEEKNHSSSVLVSIVYPCSIVTNIRKQDICNQHSLSLPSSTSRYFTSLQNQIPMF